MRDAIEQTKNHIGVDGVFNMTPADHMGLDLSSFRILEVSNNDWKLVN